MTSLLCYALIYKKPMLKKITYSHLKASPLFKGRLHTLKALWVKNAALLNRYIVGAITLIVLLILGQNHAEHPILIGRFDLILLNAI